MNEYKHELTMELTCEMIHDFKSMYEQYECGYCGYKWGSEHPDGGMRSVEYAIGDICPCCNAYQEKEDLYDSYQN